MGHVNYSEDVTQIPGSTIRELHDFPSHKWCLMVLVVHVLKISVKFSEWSFVYIMELGCDTWLIKSWTWTLETIAHVVHGHFIAYSPLKILSKHEDIHRIGECFFPIPCPHCPQESSPTWYWAWNRVWSIRKIVPMILNIAIGFGSFHPSSVHRKKSWRSRFV